MTDRSLNRLMASRQVQRGAWLFVLLLLGGQPLAAQSLADASLVPGQRLRVTAPSYLKERAAGTFIAKDTETLTLALAEKGRPHVSVPLTTIEYVEVGNGRREGRSALIGAGIGFVTLGLVASTGDTFFSKSEMFIMGGISGSLLGGLVGVAVAPTRWQPLPGGQRLAVAPQAGGSVGLTLALR